MRKLIGDVAALCAALCAAFAAPAAHADPNALWRIVNAQCVPNEEHYRTPLPCIAVHLDPGYVVLKDRVGIAQLLVMPTARITGIEDPAVLAPVAPNYFALAWQTLDMVRALAGRDLPDDALSLAINSKYGRTQNQLHIHVDCLRPEVREALLAHEAAVSSTWQPFPVPLEGRTYLARTADSLNRPDETPFDLVAKGIPPARAAMAKMTILVTAEPAGPYGPRFLLLAHEANPPLDPGSAEELQDHGCALARTP